MAAAVPAWMRQRGVKKLCITPGSPWVNPHSESFKDGFLNRERLACLPKARVSARSTATTTIINDCIPRANTNPHSCSRSAACGGFR